MKKNDFTFHEVTDGWSESDALLILRTLLLNKTVILSYKNAGGSIFMDGKQHIINDGWVPPPPSIPQKITNIYLGESANPNRSSVSFETLGDDGSIIHTSGYHNTGLDNDMTIFHIID